MLGFYIQDQGAQSLYEHKVRINADAFTPAVDAIPTGKLENHIFKKKKCNF